MQRLHGYTGGGDDTIYTIGHSTRTMEEFMSLLETNNIRTLVDVRSIPGSRKFPWFDSENIARVCRERGIGYIWLRELGGRRKGPLATENGGWRSKSFRNYADYMQTKEFREGLGRLMTIAREGNTAIMCAEAVPWRCHRSLIADALTAEGWRVLDIISTGSVRIHRMTKFAKIITRPDGELTVIYPADAVNE